MVESRLTESQPEDEPTRVVVPFNPWLVSGSEQLVSQFVAELAVALPRALGWSRGAKAGDRLQRYAGGLQTLERAPGVGWMFQVAGAVLNEAGRRVDDSPATVFDEREQACQALKELDVHVVVLVDDVDRLQPGEIQDLMRMIKLVGDFPNVTYLLAFDRKVVRCALSAEGTDGSEYLEKIVQIEYRLPEPPPEMLEKLLIKGLNRAVGTLPDRQLASDRWEAVYTEIVRPLVSRPRHVLRFTNALPLALDLAGEEINKVDVIALTALQALSPGFHGQILALREDLTRRAGNLLMLRKDDEVQQASAARLNKAAETSGIPVIAHAIYRHLFPASMAALSNTYLDEQARWQAERRVADSEVFDTYFTATLPTGAVSVVEVREAVDAFAHEPDTLAAVLNAQPAEKIPDLLQRIWGHVDEISLRDIDQSLPVLDAQVARLPDSPPGLWTPADRGRSFIRDLVARFPEGEQRDGAVRRKFEISSSLTEKFMWLRSVGSWEDPADPFCSPDLKDALRTELAREVLSSTPEALLAEVRPAWLLRTAEDDGGDDASERIAALLEDGRLLPAYLGGFVALMAGSANYELQFDELEKRQGRDRLLTALERVDAASLSDEERDRTRQLAEHYGGQADDERTEQGNDPDKDSRSS